MKLTDFAARGAQGQSRWPTLLWLCGVAGVITSVSVSKESVHSIVQQVGRQSTFHIPPKIVQLSSVDSRSGAESTFAGKIAAWFQIGVEEQIQSSGSICEGKISVSLADCC